MIDEHLDWSTHVETLSNKIVRDIYLLKRIKQFIGQRLALLFYKSVIQSKFDYCDIVWGNVGKGFAQKVPNFTEPSFTDCCGCRLDGII